MTSADARWLDMVRKAALPYTPPDSDLAEMMRRFRHAHGLNTTKAGEWLGLSARTIEGIEQGRGHSAPRLLAISLAVLTAQKSLKDPVDIIR